MAIAFQPKFPIPDRTNRPIRTVKDEDGVIDIGWCDGVLSDGRGFRAETWAQDQVTVLTVLFSVVGLAGLDQAAMKRFIEQEQLVAFGATGPRYCTAAMFTDEAGNQFWSVNIVVGDDEETYIAGSVPVFPYSRVGEPNTMFNPVPIKAAHLARAR